MSTMRKQYADPELVPLQEEVDRVTRDARRYAPIRGKVIKDVAVPAAAASPNTVRIVHKLGKTPGGYKVVKGTAQFTESSRDARFLVLEGTGSSGTTIDLEVYP